MEIPPGVPAGPAGCGSMWVAVLLAVLFIGLFILGIWWMLSSAAKL